MSEEKEMVEVECLNCDLEFETSSQKKLGDKFTCPHCNHEHTADIDDIGEGQFWYAT